MNTQLIVFLRNNLKLILFSFLFISCEKEKTIIPNCQEARELAKLDFEKKKYIYYEYQYLNDDKSTNSNFASVLKQKNIKVIFKTKYPESCIPDDKKGLEYSKYCYQEQMNRSVEAKFGHKFLDSARTKSQNK
jgi:hypothetical protein